MNSHHPVLAGLLRQTQLPSLSPPLLPSSLAKYDIKGYQIEYLNADKFLSIYAGLEKR